MSGALVLEGVGLRVPGGARWLVRALDLAVGPREIVAVLGPSGSGKTTLLRSMAGLLAVDEGSVRFDGRAVRTWAPRERATTIAWLPQRDEPWIDLAAREIVALGRTPRLGALAAMGVDDHAAVDAALAAVEAGPLADRRLSTLSGGERQRVMLARMVVSGARLLVLDEPTASLDIGHALRVLACCARLAETGAAIVFATHDVELAGRFASTIVCLGARTLVGPPDEVLVPEILGPLYGVTARWDRRLVFDPT